MRKPKLSLIIPYERRLDNLKLALQGLLNQTMDPAEFEVVIGTTKYDEDFVVACDKAARHLNLVTVMTHERFEIPRARNMAMRQASGAVTVNMDADTLLPPDALERLYERHFAFGQNACIVGQVLGYGNNYDGDVRHVESEPFEIWQKRLEEMRSTTDQPLDPRFTTDHVIPWSFAWTGLIALPTVLVREHDLYFDESFVGWGVDDIEWGYRIAATRAPIVLRKDVYALHLPHVRDTAANFVTEAASYRQFLRKWPGPDVELAAAFSDFEANDLYLDFLAELRSALPGGADLLGTVRVTVEGAAVAFLGVPLDSAHRIVDPDVRRAAVSATDVEVLPLVGMAVPFDDASVTECRVLPTVRDLSGRYREKVMATARRLAPSVVEVGA
ncbi:glycosyltransferase family 2 protein [Dactylosporangium roseum]|uniref:Glycosyltransferase family 2 protein n=1 Tax=Dactylosporangium roseum TaxID=47989 RepID=A0ABY5ZB29_9ACTN|nr:glycosyltransferase [Dactylosporangium roseum]UWZ39308.1 glycosyltransferase family 2 protein [Dactylosporangium roseum]